jgi:arylformamidase
MTIPALPARSPGKADPDGGWIDVSAPLTEGMVRWPGDPPPRFRAVARMEAGDPVNLTHLDMGAHTGTHMDAPRHFRKDGAPIDRMPLSAGIGPARILATRDPERIRPAELEPRDIQPGERLLFRTTGDERPCTAPPFREDFAGLSAEAARFLVQRGVRLVGVDTLSVDAFSDETAPAHHILLSAGIWIVEGLNLSRVPPGRCDLICLPLPIVGADGAPARAVVRPRTG